MSVHLGGTGVAFSSLLAASQSLAGFDWTLLNAKLNIEAESNTRDVHKVAVETKRADAKFSINEFLTIR